MRSSSAARRAGEELTSRVGSRERLGQRWEGDFGCAEEDTHPNPLPLSLSGPGARARRRACGQPTTASALTPKKAAVGLFEPG